MSLRKKLFANPFVKEEPKLPEEVEPQPAATRLELWGYYLYYNGVCIRINDLLCLSYLLTMIAYRTMVM